MVPRNHVGERGGTLDDGEGQERVFPGTRVADAPRGIRAVGSRARTSEPRHD